MREYKKSLILLAVVIVLMTLIIVFMTTDIDLLFFKNLSLVGIENKKLDVENLIETKAKKEEQYNTQKETLNKTKNEFDVAKTEYENIDSSTINLVQDATRDEKYFIEYLWVVIGNYAKLDNVLAYEIVPTKKIASDTQTNTTNANEKAGTSSTSNNSKNTDTANNTSGQNRTKITVVGRYSDVADFVFDLENDSSLKFKLDNISMTYSTDNKITATFDVISLSVLD